MTLTNS